MRIPPPPTIEEARAIALGARILVNWAECGWFEGRVAQVDLGRDLLPGEDNPDEDINPNAIYLNIEYPAQQGADRWYEAESEDRQWHRVFQAPRHSCVVLELGPGGRQLFPDFNPPAEQLRAQLLSQAPVATPAKRKSSGGRSTGKSKGAPIKAGALEKIELERFMCHTHFVHEFGPRVSVVVGQNGSGKSALLQALQCCLGVRAAATGRYGSLKKFVQSEDGHAVIRLTLWNTGPDAYRRSELGPKATIVRRFSATGTSSFEVLDCTGRVALRGTKEVLAMVDALGIDGGNVAMVLTQEMAKSFAGQKSEREKFTGFMEATEFDTTLECLRNAQERISEMEAALEELAAAIERLGGELQAKEQLVVQLQEVDAWSKHQQALECVAAWALILAKEQEIAAKQEELGTALPALREAAEAQVASFREQLRGIEGRLDELGHRLQESEAAGREREAEFRQVREDLKAQASCEKTKVHAAQTALRDSEAELEALAAEKESLEAANRDVTAELEASTQQVMDRHRQRVAAARNAVERAGVAASDARQYVAEREAAAEQAQAAHKAASRSSIEAQDRVRQLEGELRRLQASQGDRLARFGGAGATELHQAVAAAVAAGRFRHPPIQIGSQLSLADDRWALAMEAALRNLLDAWIVDSQADATQLRRLRSQLRQPLDRLTVVVMPYHHPLHNIPASALLPEDLVTCLRVLRFEEGPHAHVVKNVLIDQAAIERTVLTHTQREALELVRNGSLWRQYALANAYAQDGSVAYLRGQTQISRPPPPGLRRPRLVRDVSQQVGECQRELREAQRRVAEAQAVERQAHADAKQAREELTAAKRRQQGAERERATAKTQYDEVHTEQPLAIDPAEGGEAGRRLAQLANQLLEAEVQRDVLEDELKREQEEAERLQRRLQDLKAVPRDASHQLERWQQDIVDLGHEKRGVETELAAAEAACAEHMAQSAALRREVHDAEAQLAMMLDLAEQTCSRDEAAERRNQLIAAWREEGQSDEAINQLLHDVPGLTVRIETVERKIAGYAAAGLTAAEAQRQAEKLRLRIHKLRVRYETAEALCEKFEIGHQLRRKKFKELRGNIATALSKAFQRYLRPRNHMGSIEVNYKERRLIFEVQLDGHERPTRNLKQDLSGGERSYTSLAFILALGRVGINPPFHALDEFDVFMDGSYRRGCFMYLFEFQLQHPDRQLLLFTPQDSSVVKDARELVEAKYGPQTDDFVKQAASLLVFLRRRRPRLETVGSGAIHQLALRGGLDALEYVLAPCMAGVTQLVFHKFEPQLTWGYDWLAGLRQLRSLDTSGDPRGVPPVMSQLPLVELHSASTDGYRHLPTSLTGLTFFVSDKFIVPDTDVAALAALVNLRQLVVDASWYDDHVLDMDELPNLAGMQHLELFSMSTVAFLSGGIYDEPAASIRAKLPLHRFKFDVTTHHLPQLNDGLPWHTDGPYNGQGRSL
ncbi:hypothetical protein COHA_002846 [Chlorella ohadii]|uniref:RecF/RecN/SMC N-terminal domain-containing protein n=1 Tax=Chlorella ohadii TaxID=2649997 RepID=A0AAD5H452_9CHLO|nr:hypothetical protein COHA_002846 [Chlorella ohadii]